MSNRRKKFSFGVVAVFGATALGGVAFSGHLFKSAAAQNQAPPAKARIFDRVALALTGSLGFTQLRSEYVNGSRTINDVVAAMVASNEFLETSSRFWLAKMKINGVVDFENIRTRGGQTVMGAMLPSIGSENSRTLEWVTQPSISGGGYFRLSTNEELMLQGVVADDDLKRLIANKAQVECQLTERTFVRNAVRVCPAPYNRFDNSLPATTDAQKSNCKIPAVSAADINANANTITGPWFAASGTVATQVCPGVKERCGEKLERCFPGRNFQLNINAFNGPINVLIPNLRKDFTLEPGMIAARVIADGRPWEDVLRATDAPMTGAQEAFLTREWGSRILENSPAGTYRENGELTLDATRPSFDRRWEWRERGDLHAGVLTTISFQKAFNGWRAKSASSLEAFLCRVFEVPPGVAVLPSAEVDLTRKPYCQSCHSVLEPLSLFFGRWPNLGGNNNYLYDSGSDRVATGVYENMNNADTNGLARVYTSTKAFHDCGVARAFEMMVGRAMNEREMISMMPTLQRAYRDGGNRILPVFKAIAAGPLFERSRQ